MTKMFCDRCGDDITGVTSGRVEGIADADNDGGGKITHEADLCPRCYSTLVTWLTMKPVNIPKS